MSEIENRCRLVLVAPPADTPEDLVRIVGDALRGGDVASVIIPQRTLDERRFQAFAEALVPVIQAAGAAALVAGDSRTAGRAHADGMHIAGAADAVQEAMERFSPKMIVGGGNAKTRHHALEIGECRPDYVFFGKIDGDIKPVAHPRNIELAEWWASIVEVPCIVMGGSSIESVAEVAETGAEFCALGAAIFDDPAAAAQSVAAANALLDEKAPRFQE